LALDLLSSIKICQKNIAVPHLQSRLLSANVQQYSLCSLERSALTTVSHALGPGSLGLKVNAFFCLGNLLVPFHLQMSFFELQQLTQHPELDRTHTITQLLITFQLFHMSGIPVECSSQ
jgi:hypothetical protein